MAKKGSAFVRLMMDFDFSRAEWFDAARGSLVTAAIFLVLALTGNTDDILPLSLGAVLVAVAESGLPFGRRWRTMLWTTVWLMVALLVGVAVSASPLLTIAITVPVAFICGAVGYLGPRAAVAGLLSLVVFAAYAGAPISIDTAPKEVALLGLGGLLQTAVCVIVGVIRHRGSLRATDEVHHARPTVLRTTQQAFLRHGVRLAVVMGVATAISELVSVPHAYWLPVAVAWMTRPDRDGTVSRVVQRLAGTALGVVIIGVPGWILGTGPAFYIVFALIGSTIAIAFVWVNYHIGVAGITIWLLAIIGLDGSPLGEDIFLRIGLTVCGALLVLLGTYIWRDRTVH